MGVFFTLGEKKIRPGVYNRYENSGPPAETTNNRVATLFGGIWGPVNAVQTLTPEDSIGLLYGNESSDIINLAIEGGAGRILAVRIGSGGVKGSASLKDTAGTPANAITATLKYEGTRALGYIIREMLGDPNYRELVITEDGVILEKVTFPASADGEVDALIAAVSVSNYVDLAKVDGYVGTGKLALVASGTFAGGTNPTLTNESYANGLALLETKRWDCIIADTNDVAVHAIMAGFVNRMYLLGRMGFAVVGEPSTSSFDTRCAHAAAYNDYNVIYVGMGYKNTAGEKIEGWKAAAYIAGLVAGTTSDKGITHAVIPNAKTLIEEVTDAQYQKSIKSGMITFSTSSDDKVWVESGITTLINPSGEDDPGWKKIKRTRIRFEMMMRISDVTEPLVGRVAANDDGRATIIQAAQGVLNDMVSEAKLNSGAVIELVKGSSADPDSAYFNISAYDIDSIDKFYLVYKFRFSAEA